MRACVVHGVTQKGGSFQRMGLASLLPFSCMIVNTSYRHNLLALMSLSLHVSSPCLVAYSRAQTHLLVLILIVALSGYWSKRAAVDVGRA